jgi:hypothetical protein
MAAATATATPVSEAASFYHQGRFDSAFTRLEALKSSGDMKRRDSLSLYQYLGMASARLGRGPEAEGHFATLLELDSLFQFPRNEDPLVLSAFTRARAQRPAQRAMTPVPPAAPLVRPQGPTGADSSAIAASPAAALPTAASPAAPAPKTSPTATFAPQRGRHADDRPLVLAGIALTEVGAAGPMDGAGIKDAHGRQGPGNPPSIGLALGAMPFGTGWFVRNKFKHGLALSILQAGGLALSMYASHMQTMEAEDIFRVQDENERSDIKRWQWVQRVSLSTAVGAYVFSLIASAGD